MARIELDDLHLHYQIRRGASLGLKATLFRKLLRRAPTPIRQIHALRGVSLRVGDGQRVGIIGHNGAGKSTLLHVMAGIYPPTGGTRSVDGRISSLFNISLGFEPEATGWENIRYRSYLQGETPKTLQPKLAGIAEFSELGDFLDLPVRSYSSGMQMRLAFSIATAVDPEILLVDEVLGVGDLSFQQKAARRVNEMMTAARVIILVSHDLGSIERLCNRVIWMSEGRVRRDGDPEKVIEEYVASVAKDELPCRDLGNAA